VSLKSSRVIKFRLSVRAHVQSVVVSSVAQFILVVGGVRQRLSQHAMSPAFVQRRHRLRR